MSTAIVHPPQSTRCFFTISRLHQAFRFVSRRSDQAVESRSGLRRFKGKADGKELDYFIKLSFFVSTKLPETILQKYMPLGRLLASKPTE